MGQEMPSLVKCSQCPRTFPVRAQMQFEGKSLPVLVVLCEVDSVEAALEQTICQVCLGKTGSLDRSLYEVLKRLGLKDEDEVPPPREAAVVIHARKDRVTSTVGVVVSDSRPREVAIVDPLMGTSIEVQARPAHDRRPRGPRRDNWRPASSESRVSRALREPERREPQHKVEPLTSKLGKVGDNAAVLEVAMKAAKERDETRRVERAQKFDKLFFWLHLALARIRKNAATTEIWDLVESFQCKLGEAVAFDAQQRGKKGLLLMLGTSPEGLEALCHEFYLGKEPLRPRRPIEVVMVDAFEGGRRPESWDLKGSKRPAFYELEVVRTKSSLPIPNPPLPGGDGDPRPRIVYPDGEQFGPNYTVEHSRRGDRHQFDWELKPFGWAIVSLVSWLGDHLDLEIGGLNLCGLVCSYAEPIVMEEDEDPVDETIADDSHEPSVLSSDLPTNT